MFQYIIIIIIILNDALQLPEAHPTMLYIHLVLFIK